MDRETPGCPASKKTHTKSTDRIQPPYPPFEQSRAQVAAEAARIIATEGQHNYHAAKKKAAERIGVSERLALPSNIEVKEALSAYQNLYGGEQHQDNLERLRQSPSRPCSSSSIQSQAGGLCSGWNSR